jgi:voltage-gated potassium channel
VNTATIERLRAVPLFAEVSDDALEHVAALVTEFEAEAGHVLVQLGASGSGMFVLEQGEVVVELPGHPVELGPGEFFGELAILADGVARTARVRAKTDVRCLAINRMDFAALLEQQPRIAVAMLPVLARRLAEVESAG